MEIKFRGFSTENNCWIHGFYHEVEVEGIKNAYIFWQGESWNVDIKSVGVFTGLIDKNKVEIYTTDILKVVSLNIKSIRTYDKYQPKQEGLYFCIKLKSGFTLCPIRVFNNMAKIPNDLVCNVHGYIDNYDFWNGAKSSLQIIGNIYENSNLIN